MNTLHFTTNNLLYHDVVQLDFHQHCLITNHIYDMIYNANCYMMDRNIDTFGKDYDKFLHIVNNLMGKILVHGCTCTEQEFTHILLESRAAFEALPQQVKHCYCKSDTCNIIPIIMGYYEL